MSAPESPPTKTIGIKHSGPYQERQSIRVLVLNDKTEICLLYAAKEDYYKLPGGGIEAGESHKVAGEREMLEETGCTVTLGEKLLATVEEWRGDLHQTSFAYVAQLVQDTGKLALTEEELEDGLKHLWVPLSSATQLMEGAKPTSGFGKSVRERDIFIVSRYLKYLVDKAGQ